MSAETEAYSFTHNNPDVGLNYYRVVAISNSGQRKLSNVASFRMGGSDHTVSVFPNPATDELSVFIKGGDQQELIQIYNSTGLLVKSIRLVNNKISVADLPTGLYFLKSADGVIRLMKQ